MMKKLLIKKSRIKKINKFFRHYLNSINKYDFYKNTFNAPYGVVACGHLSSNNFFFLKRLLLECGKNSFSVLTSRKHMHILSRRCFLDLRGKHILSLSFDSLYSLQRFFKSLDDLLILNKTQRLSILFIKVNNNILSNIFFKNNFLYLTRYVCIKQLVKLNGFSVRLLCTLVLNILSYYIKVLKIFYFNSIICQLYIKRVR